MTYRVGKVAPDGAVEPAFTVDRTEGGGIALSAIHRLTDADKMVILGHYGRPITGRVLVTRKGVAMQHMRQFQPGTQAHFDQASYGLPSPFELLHRQG